MPDWACLHCGDVNLVGQSRCGNCGRQSDSVMVPSSSIVRHCPYDGGELMASGLCLRRGGFPLGQRCGFVCPLCRGSLDWSGGCDRCHGTTTGRREDWAFPGDRYDCYDDFGKPIGDGVHWVKTDGPRQACSVQENKAHALRITQMLGRFGARP